MNGGVDRFTGGVTTPSFPTPVRGWRDRFAGWMGRLVTAAGIWSLVSIPLSRLGWTGRVEEAFELVNLPVAPSLFTVVLLLALGSALRRRVRFAFYVLLLFEMFAVALGVVALARGPLALDVAGVDVSVHARFATVLAGVVGAVIAAALLAARGAFPARLRPGSRGTAFFVLVCGLSLSAVVSIALTETFPGRLTGGWPRLNWALRIVVGLFGSATPPGLNGQDGPPWITDVVGVFSAGALLAAVFVFLRSARSKRFAAARDELDLRRIVLLSGERDSLGYFATRRDKSVIFSPDRNAAVTYRVLASTSLASADPVGAVSSWPAAIEAWLGEARRYGWYPAVLSASERGAEAYVAAGLQALKIGDEAIMDVDDFNLSASSMAPVRRSVRRLRRAGYTVHVSRHGDLTADELAQIAQCVDAWRADRTERGFSMALGRLGDPADTRAVAVIARDSGGQLRGVLSLVPWGQQGLSLDLMRSDRAAENGLTEFMVAGLITAAAELGVRRVSLNFAMFREVFSDAERVGAGRRLRLISGGLSFASRFWQIEGLYRSNAKYLPRWQPRFLCYDPATSLVRAAIVAGMAEGFLPVSDPMAPRTPDATVQWRGNDDVPFARAVAEMTEEVLTRRRPPRRLTDQQRARHDKVAVLARAGASAYPRSVPRSDTVADVLSAHAGLPADTYTGRRVSITGRVRAVRDFGGLVFAVLQEGDKTLQVMLTRERTGGARLDLWQRTVDLGDQLSVTGEVITTRHGEISVHADEWAMASKSLQPIPRMHSGLTDRDARVRKRYLDLILNPDARAMIVTRTIAVRALRGAFAGRGFLEVETPMLQAIHGGADARPFRTRINAYAMNLYLRIAPELFLKQLCVGGMDKIFELNRNFRNEGADSTHNPEFTMLEAYQAWADYDVMRELTRDVILEVASAVHGRAIARRFDALGNPFDVDLDVPWPTVTVHAAVGEALGSHITPDTPADRLRAAAEQHGIRLPAETSAGALVVELYEQLVEPSTDTPTFYTDFPLEVSPLARAHRDDHRLAERWDLVAFGMEIGTAYSELINPIDQRERLTKQSIRAAGGDPNRMQIDESFLTALEYAMPPTGGLGIGVDRLVMLLTGTNIRQTLSFPFVRGHP